MVLALLVSVAHAVQYQGTPALTFRVDRPADDYVEGTVTLDRITIHHCGGGSTDVVVGATIDPVLPTTVQIPAGDHCALTFRWDTVLDVDGPAYTVRYAESTTSVLLDESIAPEPLTPYTVVAGSMNGSGPWLLVDIL
jgi:hypothetical protein